MNSLPQNDRSVNTDQVAAGLLRSMFDDSYKPNGALPELGARAVVVSEVDRAYRGGGAAAARATFEALAKGDAGLWALVSGDLDQGGRFRLIPASELGNLPRPVWLLDKIIHRAAFALLYGASGVGKTFLALDWALKIAQTANAVYVAAEGASGYAARVLVWCKHHDKGPGGLHFLLDAITLLDPASLAQFIEAARPLAPALVVIDTWARCLGGDENSTQDTNAGVAAVDHIRRELGAAVLIVHHSGVDSSRERGNTALRGAADVVVRVTGADGPVKISCDKSKDAAPFDAFYLRSVVVETGRETEDGAETSCVLLPAKEVVVSGKLTERERQILEFLAMPIWVKGAQSKQIKEGTAIPQGTVWAVLNELVRRGLVHQAARGEPYTIGESGLKALGVERVFLNDD